MADSDDLVCLGLIMTLLLGVVGLRSCTNDRSNEIFTTSVNGRVVDYYQDSGQSRLTVSKDGLRCVLEDTQNPVALNLSDNNFTHVFTGLERVTIDVYDNKGGVTNTTYNAGDINSETEKGKKTKLMMDKWNDYFRREISNILNIRKGEPLSNYNDLLEQELFDASPEKTIIEDKKIEKPKEEVKINDNPLIFRLDF